MCVVGPFAFFKVFFACLCGVSSCLFLHISFYLHSACVCACIHSRGHVWEGDKPSFVPFTATLLAPLRPPRGISGLIQPSLMSLLARHTGCYGRHPAGALPSFPSQVLFRSGSRAAGQLNDFHRIPPANYPSPAFKIPLKE